MADGETLFTFLNRREQQLTHQISALRGQIEAMENELAYVKKAKAATAISASLNQQLPDDVIRSTAIVGPIPEEVAQRFAAMTIKQLVVRALLDNFPNGATSGRLRDFIRDAYGRAIEASSLRPQLHRLKADGVINTYHPGASDHWSLNPEKRRQYTLYDHPSSQAARTELQKDEAPDSNGSNLTFEQGGDVHNVKRRK
jgi:hypothetical protein